MILRPEITWLIDRWGLPLGGDAPKEIEALLESERGKGCTASEISSSVSSWGSAVTRISEGQDENHSPLVMVVLDGGERFLQSRRCYLAEKSIAEHIKGLANLAPINSINEEGEEDPALSEAKIRFLFPQAEQEDLQVAAARAALEQQLTIITGGPGTGKTFTLARILSLLMSCGINDDEMMLAAPTGKAADRMKQSVVASVDGLTPDEITSLNRIAGRSGTLHKLMGYNPSIGRCRHNASNPLPCRVLIVDECSMVDVHLWKALLEALTPETRLILLGDPKQLQSVGQGNVFGVLAEYAVEKLAPLSSSLVHLVKSRRFEKRPGIMKLAKALEDSDPRAARELLERAKENPDDGIVWIESSEGMLPYGEIPANLRNAIESAAVAITPKDALEAISKVCILTAHRDSFIGAESISKEIARNLSLKITGTDRPTNEPIIINENDPETGLRNGAVGVIRSDAEGRRLAWFPKDQGAPVSHTVGSLPDHSPAWAITIHRSQGSEYEDVLVILPREKSDMATRELLYTAITRAKENVIIVGTMEAVEKAVVTTSDRITLLRESLDRVF